MLIRYHVFSQATSRRLGDMEAAKQLAKQHSKENPDLLVMCAAEVRTWSDTCHCIVSTHGETLWYRNGAQV